MLISCRETFPDIFYFFEICTLYSLTYFSIFIQTSMEIFSKRYLKFPYFSKHFLATFMPCTNLNTQL